MANFKILEKVVNDYTVDGFILEDAAGNTQPVNIETVTKLARAGKVDGAEAVLDSDSGNYILHLDKKLVDIPTNRNAVGRKLSLTARILDSNGSCVGYKAKDLDGKDYKLSINKAWDLASNGVIDGVSGYILNGYKVLLSTEDHLLENLPKLS